jgi:aspartyl-tRNA(Asn)/glutamyl-tRNA(Gln) amidotransferase subunit B
MSYEAVIGLEVHVQLKTQTKMFCGCKNEYGGAPNTHVCPVCLGLPGALPVPNEEAVVRTIQTGLMLGCTIAPRCKFDRKNYFYPDMPKNYQISQYDLPLCLDGAVPLDLYAFPKDVQNDAQAKANRLIRLERIHLEEDVAKSQHFDRESGIDFNRAGTPLMEIVSRADIQTAEEAFAYLTALQRILIYGGVSDADMEKGQMRCDVNISVRPVGQEEYGTKCELKNLNTISGVRRALKYEIDRQIEVVTSGGVIRQETRRWDDVKGVTTIMRIKEKAHDYRYFPDPDILPLRTDKGLKAEATTRVPELPAAKAARFQKDFGVSEYQASVLAAERPFADYFETAAAAAKNKVTVANFLLNDYLASVGGNTAEFTLPPSYFSELANLLEDQVINSKQAKDVFAFVLSEKKSPGVIVEEKGLKQTTDLGALDQWCNAAIAANPKSVADFKSGKMGAINALKGFVMKQSQGKANPKVVDEILLKKLS